MNFFPFLPQILTTATEIPHTPQPHSSNSASTTTGSQSRHINKLLRSVQDGSEEDSGRKWQKFIHLSTDHFTLLTTCFQQQQEVLRSFLMKSPRESSPEASSSRISTSIKHMDHYNNAKYEDIICRLIKLTYDGTPDLLVPFLNRLELRCQDESWSAITYVKQGGTTYDVIRHFAKIDVDTITGVAQNHWTATTVMTDKLTFGHETYSARCLACLLLSSLTDEFAVPITT